jgi:hypothetical protein
MQTSKLNFLTFPIWWYTEGTGIILHWLKNHFQYTLRQTHLLLFFRHLNEPLYQDYSRAGRALSFFLRIFILIFKTLYSSLRLLICFLLAILFLLWPVICVLFIIGNFLTYVGI